MFDPEPEREKLRRHLAYAALALFAVTVLAILLTVAAGWRSWEDMEGVTAAVLPAVISVTGTTLGFYFASRESKGG